MPALTRRQIHPIAQIILDDPGHRPELLLDPLRYQTGRARSITVSAGATIRPPLDNRLATVAAWLDWHCLHIASAELVSPRRYRIVVGMLQ